MPLTSRSVLCVSGCGWSRANGRYFPQGSRNEASTYENRHGCVLSVEVHQDVVAWVLGRPATTTTTATARFEPLYALRPGAEPGDSTPADPGGEWLCDLEGQVGPAPRKVWVLDRPCPSLRALTSSAVVATGREEEEDDDDFTSNPLEFLLMIKGHAIRLREGEWLVEAMEALDLVMEQAMALGSFAAPNGHQHHLHNGSASSEQLYETSFTSAPEDDAFRTDNFARIARECRVLRAGILLDLGRHSDAMHDVHLLEGEEADVIVLALLRRVSMPVVVSPMRATVPPAAVHADQHMDIHAPPEVETLPRVPSQLEKGGVTLRAVTTPAAGASSSSTHGDLINFHVDARDPDHLQCKRVGNSSAAAWFRGLGTGHAALTTAATATKLHRSKLTVSVVCPSPHRFLLELRCPPPQGCLQLDLSDLGASERARCVRMFEEWTGRRAAASPPDGLTGL